MHFLGIYICRWSTLHCRQSCRKKDRQKKTLWHRCRWLPTESLRTQSFFNRSTLSRCVTAQQTSYQNNKALSDFFFSIGKRGFLERPKDASLKCRHPSLIQTLLTACKKIALYILLLLMYENHSASSKTHIFDSLAENVFHRSKETVLRRRWMLFSVIWSRLGRSCFARKVWLNI